MPAHAASAALFRTLPFALACLSAALHIDGAQLLSRRGAVSFGAAAAASAALTVAQPSYAERNVITKEEAALMKAEMISRYSKPGEETEESLANQERRKQLYAAIKAKADAFEAKVKAVETAKDAETFTEAANELSLYILKEGRVTEGVKVKDIIKRLRIAFNNLPQKKVKCPPDVRPGTTCTSPGPLAEDSYGALVDVVRKASTKTPGATEAF